MWANSQGSQRFCRASTAPLRPTLFQPPRPRLPGGRSGSIAATRSNLNPNPKFNQGRGRGRILRRHRRQGRGQRSSAWAVVTSCRHGLTLVHSEAQPEPVLSLKQGEITQRMPQDSLTLSRKWTSVSLCMPASLRVVAVLALSAAARLVPIVKVGPGGICFFFGHSLCLIPQMNSAHYTRIMPNYAQLCCLLSQRRRG